MNSCHWCSNPFFILELKNIKSNAVIYDWYNIKTLINIYYELLWETNELHLKIQAWKINTF